MSKMNPFLFTYFAYYCFCLTLLLTAVCVSEASSTKPLGSYVLLKQGRDSLQFQVRLQWPSSWDVTVKPPSFPSSHPLHKASLKQMGSWQDDDQMIQAYEFLLDEPLKNLTVPGIEVSYIQNGNLNGLHIDEMVLPLALVSHSWTHQDKILLFLGSILILGIAILRSKFLPKERICKKNGEPNLEKMMLEALEKEDFSKFFCLNSCPEFGGFSCYSKDQVLELCNAYRYAGQNPEPRFVQKVRVELREKLRKVEEFETEEFLKHSLKE